MIEVEATPTNSATSTFDMMLLHSGAINAGVGADVMSFSGTGSTSAGAPSSSGGEGSSGGGGGGGSGGGGGGIYASAAAVERLPPVGTWKKRPPPSLNTTRYECHLK